LSSSADIRATQYDGVERETLANRVDVPRVEVFERVSSTLDVAHAIAPDAPSGTLILAEEQVAGRGRHGRRWTSEPGVGIWLTLIERPRDPQALDVLALRCGLEAAAALAPLAGGRICVKWPNDLHVGDGKLAGILIETRWRGTAPEWVAIGFGLNVVAPDVPTARGLRAGVPRIDALTALVPALRRAANAIGHLTPLECETWRARDLAAGRDVLEPAVGEVQGITPSGELRIREADGVVRAYRSGSLTFATPVSCS
jgi:BirA family biotin operon repressor/biotin-[acetyl-CoA-carboxylase] ligase